MEMLSESERPAGSSGVLVYDYLYELDSTRGRKRILSSVRMHACQTLTSAASALYSIALSKTAPQARQFRH